VTLLTAKLRQNVIYFRNYHAEDNYYSERGSARSNRSLLSVRFRKPILDYVQEQSRQSIGRGKTFRINLSAVRAHLLLFGGGEEQRSKQRERKKTEFKYDSINPAIERV